MMSPPIPSPSPLNKRKAFVCSSDKKEARFSFDSKNFLSKKDWSNSSFFRLKTQPIPLFCFPKYPLAKKFPCWSTNSIHSVVSPQFWARSSFWISGYPFFIRFPAFFFIYTFMDSPTLTFSFLSIPKIRSSVLVLAFTKYKEILNQAWKRLVSIDTYFSY